MKEELAKLAEDVTQRRRLMRIGTVMLSFRPLSGQEASYKLLGLQFYGASRTLSVYKHVQHVYVVHY
jgi:hypothetical protein